VTEIAYAAADKTTGTFETLKEGASSGTLVQDTQAKV